MVVVCLTSDFPLESGIPAEDFLCVPEPDEDECLSSGLDGDETSHKQVSVEASWNRSTCAQSCSQAKESMCVTQKKQDRGQGQGHGDRQERLNVKSVWRHSRQG